MSVSYVSGFSLKCEGGLPYLSCSALGVPHGFSTRLGGVSYGEGLDTLDLGMGDAVSVAENRRCFLTAIGADPARYFTAKQIHSPKVVTVTTKDLEREFVCDGFVTNEKGITLTVKTADCVPILLCDKEHGVIGAVHAGWRGTVSGVTPAAVQAMQALGSYPDRIVAAIGPAIHACCYEVDEPFVEAVRASTCADRVLPYITVDGEGYRADLVGMNHALLLSVGLNADNIYRSGFCTCCHSGLFFSHRASHGKRGLMMAGIRL